MVELKGTVAPVAEVTGPAKIFTLPTGFRPAASITKLCQGSGANKWLMQVEADGSVKADRYGTTSAGAFPAGAWMPFHAIFIKD